MVAKTRKRRVGSPGFGNLLLVTTEVRTTVITSAVLSLVVLGVFFGLQNYGPESVVRRFHREATSGDLRAIASVTNENPRSFAVGALVQEVQALARRGYSYEFLRVQNLTRIRVAVVYVNYIPTRGGPVLSRPWIVGKREQLWKVEAEATLDPMGFFGELQRG